MVMRGWHSGPEVVGGGRRRKVGGREREQRVKSEEERENENESADTPDSLLSNATA
jgi:hypothetical protein